MNCKFVLSGETDDGRYLHECPKCKARVRTKFCDSAKLHRTCGTATPAIKPQPKRGPCAHLGAEVRREQCQSCAGTVLVKIMACQAFGECTLGKELPGVQCCAKCPQWVTR